MQLAPPLVTTCHQMKARLEQETPLLDLPSPLHPIASHTHPLNRFNGAVSQGKPPLGLLVRLHDLIARWGQRMSERRMLARMDSRMLRDIGLSSLDASREASKPFWQK